MGIDRPEAIDGAPAGLGQQRRTFLLREDDGEAGRGRKFDAAVAA